jgi:hypothetical protein
MKLTPEFIKNLIREEFEKSFDVDVEETGADEYADALAKKIDFVKALKIEETRLNKRLKKIREQKEKTIKSINKSI